MTDRDWHKGPPPHVGWWNASANGFHDIWRWWDGRYWSRPAGEHMSATEAAALAQERAYYGSDITWSDRWPEGARVPRVNPESP